MSAGILKGKKSSVGTDKSRGVGEIFFEQAEKYGDRIFQIDADTEKQETYGDVKRRSVRVAVELKKLGVKSEDAVVMCCKNNLDNVIPFLASFYLGAYVSSVDSHQSLSDISQVLSLVEPKVVFVVEDSLELIQQSLKRLSFTPDIVVIGKSDTYRTMADLEEKNDEEDNFRPLALHGDHIALIAFSSGTTSTPKGICLSHYSLLYGFNGKIEHNTMKADVLLHRSSLYWACFAIVTALCIKEGGKKIVGTDIGAEKFLQMVEKYKVSSFITSKMFSYEITDLGHEIISKYDFSSLYSFLVTGSPIDPRQILTLRRLFPGVNVGLTYGATELIAVSGFDFTDKTATYEEKITSSGTLLPDVEIKIVDVETAEVLGPNQQGEILVKTPYIMSGYYKLDKLDSFDNDGFLRQGDFGYYDEDGYLYVTDRISESFKYNKYHVCPVVIENALLSHPSVKEAAVIGVPHPIDTAHPAACIVLKDDTQVNLNELTLLVNSKMQESHYIRGGIKIVDELPRTPNGKIRRRDLKFLFAQN